MYKLRREQFFPISINIAWDFFSSPENLEKITPPGMDFKIISGLDGSSIKDGQILVYTVKPMMSIPMRWKSKIINVAKPNHFTDVQLAGPYSVWEHSHRFITVEGGVKMIDEVDYKLPGGILGRLMHSLYVRKKLEHIFDYRHSILEKLFRK
ncbi:MAG: SRPBCC family protein [Bacteroidia bacterium]|nr:SRPBCC family protein [Bacteroidia bacterium]